jgi:prephenate dehydrogenase
LSFQRLAVLGTGLIGGSFALAARRRGLVASVVGVARSPETRQAALDCGVADEVTADAAAAVRDADLVYLAAPVGATGRLMADIAPALRPDALVTDAGSTKAGVVALAAEHLAGRCTFIGGHPMAGSDEAGPAAADPDLFVGRTYLLTPTPDTPVAALERLRDLVQQLGATVVLVEAGQHDRLVAATSHLPHLVAAALCNSLHDLASRTGDIRPFTGTGVRDATRIAKGPPEVWRDILLDNRQHLHQALVAFTHEVNRCLEAMDAGDAEALEAFLTGARDFRRGLDPA